MTSPSSTRFSYGPYIDSALRTPGGHLSIGRGGFTLHYGEGARLSGYDLEMVKAECIAAGLPVIDSLAVPFDAMLHLAVAGPMIAVGRDPDPAPWHALSFASLSAVAAAYAAAGAEVWNLPELAVPSAPATAGRAS
ncbi:hypothetical protein [Mesorhizobium sp.]|uniref:hypothetical protein n=1 Tax=Mesorhizobium sp. TaxID=1871066 RepID=UPI000FE45C91|nr:hypothetical protein [Mesorhizobium sp.]RWJ00041.1 MAG: hypothetical protein EOR23_31440 [Mesorhizobium sp.]